MKTKFIFTLMLAMFIFVACDKDEESDEICNNLEATCPDKTEIDASSCCTATDCYWTYKTNVYDCKGTDCKAAINAIISQACIQGVNLKSWDGDLVALQAQMEAVTQKLVAEARASCAACN